PLDTRQFGIDAAQLFTLDLLQPGIFRIASNEIEVMAVGNPLLPEEFSQRKNLIEIVARDYRIDVDDQPQSELSLQSAQEPAALQCFLEITGNPAHEVVRVA